MDLERERQAAWERFELTLQQFEAQKKKASRIFFLALICLAASFAYVTVDLPKSPHSVLFSGAAAICIWLFATCTLLIWVCSAEIPTPFTDDDIAERANTDHLGHQQLRKTQARLEQAEATKRRVAAWTEWLKFMALASPLVFGIASTLLRLH